MKKINKKQEIITNLKKVEFVIGDLPNEKYKKIPTKIQLVLGILNDAINEIEDELVERE